MKRSWRAALAGLVLALLMTGTVLLTRSVAQAPPDQMGPGGPAGPGGPGMMGPPPGMMGMMGMGGGGTVLAATDKFVYVVRGDTLYQFDADRLALVKQATIPGGAAAQMRQQRQMQPQQQQ